MPASTQALLLQKLAPRPSVEPATSRTARDSSRSTQEPPSFEQTLRRGIADDPKREAGTAEPGRSAKVDRKRPSAEPKRSEGGAANAQERDGAAQKPRETDAEREPRSEALGDGPRKAIEGDSRAACADPSAAEEAVDGESAAEDAAPGAPDASAGSADEADATSPSSKPEQVDVTDGEHATSTASALATARLAASGGAAGEPAASADGPDAPETTGNPTAKPRAAMLRRLASQGQVRAAANALVQGAADAAATKPGTAAEAIEQPATPGIDSSRAAAAASHIEGGSQIQAAARHREAEHAGEAASKPSQAHSTEVQSTAVRAEAMLGLDAPRPAAKGGDSIFTLERSVGAAGRTGGPTIATPARGASAATPDGSDVPGTVARGLSAAVLQRGGSVSLKLTPESLGQVRIDMTMDRGSVAVRIEAGSVAAQDLLESSMAMLRSTLEGKGLSVDRISVHLAPGAAATAAAPAPSGAQNQHEAQQQQHGAAGNSGQHNAGEGASKGRDERDPDQLWLFDNQPEEAAEDRGTFRLKLSAVA